MIVPAILIAAEASPASSGGIGAIGLDPKALVFQIVNFAILLLVLKKVAYKPILKVLHDRQERIDNSLKIAAEIEKRQEELATEQAKLLKQARAEADQIVSRAREESTALIKEAEAKASVRAEQMLAQAKAQIEQEVVSAKSELKHEMVGLVVAATSAIIDEKLDANKDKALIKRALAGGER